MKLINSIHPLEPKMEKLVEGYRGFPEPHFPLAFRDRPLLPTEVTTMFTEGLDLFAEVRRCEAKLKVAIEVRSRASPKLHALVREASQVARHHFGADAQKMATFGVTRSATAKPQSKRPHRTSGEAAVIEVITEEGSSAPRQEAKHKHGVCRPRVGKPRCAPDLRGAKRDRSGSKA